MNHTQTLRDALGNTRLSEAANVAMAVANAVQSIPSKGARIAGTAAAFLILLEESGMPAPDVLGMARNIINHAEGRRPEFAAVTDYIREEVLK